MIGIKNINIHDLSIWVEQTKTQAAQGKVIERIPQLAMANPHWFAVNIICKSDENYSLGNTDCIFPFMSAIKPFSLL
ncbi:MAG: glutaminase, partial [Dolichospermum sp.]